MLRPRMKSNLEEEHLDDLQKWQVPLCIVFVLIEYLHGVKFDKFRGCLSIKGDATRHMSHIWIDKKTVQIKIILGKNRGC